MASSIISNGLEKAQHAVNELATGNKKIADLAKDTVDNHDPSRMITSDSGTKQSNTDDWLKVVTEDKTGPLLLEDSFSREKIHRFDHERIPERVVHARGVGAFGTFRLFESAQDVTCAKVLNDTSRETPVFARFSTVLGNRGSADTVRDARGFAIKFYTDEGNWDIVGNDIPIFFIQDALKFPDLVHAAKPEPNTEVPQAQSAHNNFWDFQYLHSEATHMFMWAMSDRGIPRSLRMMQGFGVNTYSLINDAGEENFVKFHFMPALGVHSLVWDEALKLGGQDPDFHRKDLYEAIDKGVFPKWKFGIQVVPKSDEHNFEFDILDATKVWPVEQVPIRYIGELELNRNVDEYFTQTEQVAFCTSHLVKGIGFSDDPLLQGRNFSYFDTQLSRLGTNWQELPINRPVCPVMNHHRDGKLRHRITKGSVNYWPNRFGATPPAKPEEGGYVDYPAKVEGMKVRARSKKFRDHHSQAQLFYNSLAAHEKAHLASALSFELDHCPDPVVYERLCDRLREIDLSLAQQVAQNVGAPIPDTALKPNAGHKSKFLSQADCQPATPTIESRQIAILIADGYDSAAYHAIASALSAQRAFVTTIAPRRSAVRAANGSDHATPDHHLEGARSTMFDALFVPGGAASVAALQKNGRAVHWVREAFGHLKAIAATGEAVDFVQSAVGLDEVKMSTGAAVSSSYGVVTAKSPGLDAAKGGAADPTGFVAAFVGEIALHRCWLRELDGLSASVAY